MIDIYIDTKALADATREVMTLPGLFKRAQLSALQSTGWMIRGKMREFIESSGGGTWNDLHPLTRKFFKKFGMGAAQWTKSRKTSGPMSWLGKFSRYRITDDSAVVGFGKSPTGVQGTINPFLMSVIRRAENGSVTTVTPAMRKMFGATRLSNSARQQAGLTFFPLKKTTQTLETRKRPVFDPVMALVEGDITPWFEDKFWRSVTRQKERTNA